VAAIKGAGWGEDELNLLRDLIERGHTTAESRKIMEEHGYKRSHAGLENQRKRNGWQGQVAQSKQQRFDAPLVAEGDMLVLADVHAPFHDATWINRLVGVALKMGICQVGIVGDLIDMAAFSRYGRKHALEAEDEINATKAILDIFSGNFTTIWYVGGNHESRMSRWLDNTVRVETLMSLWVKQPNVTISDYHWFTLKSGDLTWHLEHPKNASIIPAQVARKLASKYHTNVIAGHGHLVGMTRDESGYYWAIDSGICADPFRLDYTVLEHNTRPQMMQGGVIVKDGIPWLITPDNIRGYE
jgi:hypothetical protein